MSEKVDWSKVKPPAFPSSGRFYSAEPEVPKNKSGFYHWSQIEKLAMGYYEDDDGYLKVTLKEGAEPSEKASGMMWMWLRVSERGTAVKHPDASNREHYEYIDEFDEFRKTEALRATRKERQVITDPLRIRELLVGDFTDSEIYPHEDFRRIQTPHEVNRLTAKFVTMACCTSVMRPERTGGIPLGRDLTQEHCDTFLNDLIEDNQNKD